MTGLGIYRIGAGFFRNFPIEYIGQGGNEAVLELHMESFSKVEEMCHDHPQQKQQEGVGGVKGDQ
jgi:hypothetical protein